MKGYYITSTDLKPVVFGITPYPPTPPSLLVFMISHLPPLWGFLLVYGNGLSTPGQSVPTRVFFFFFTSLLVLDGGPTMESQKSLFFGIVHPSIPWPSCWPGTLPGKPTENLLESFSEQPEENNIVLKLVQACVQILIIPHVAADRLIVLFFLFFLLPVCPCSPDTQWLGI